MTAVETNVHFREHDIEFLQKRTKLWLQAVLAERFEDQRSLAELIADGNILYRVAKYVIKDMTGKSPGPEVFSPKEFSEAASHGKTSGKYLPYSNVDTFLKMCRTVGLSDVDLFTPPDAVEGKDMRRVCVAIRALARRARAQHIRVPDFDDVNRPLPMPKEKVGEIREHLQHASSTPPVTPTVVTPELDIQKSERVQIITKFLSSTKTPTGSPQLGISEETVPVNITSELPSSDTTTSVAPSTPGPTIRDNGNALYSPCTPAATLAGMRTPTLRKSQSALESSPIHPLSSSFNVVPEASASPLPMFKPEWIPLQELGLEELSDSSADVTFETEKKSTEDASQLAVKEPQPEEGNRPQSRESEPDVRNPPEHRELKSQQSMKKSSSEAQLFPSPERSESKFNEAPPKLQSPVKINAVMRSGLKDSVATKPASRDSERPAVVNGLRPSSKEPAGSSKPIQINLNLRVWGPVIAGALAFFGTLLAVRSRDPVVYEVKQGDTLAKISRKTGKSTWEELIKLNPNIKNPDLIYPSERLKLPV